MYNAGKYVYSRARYKVTFSFSRYNVIISGYHTGHRRREVDRENFNYNMYHIRARDYLLVVNFLYEQMTSHFARAQSRARARARDRLFIALLILSFIIRFTRLLYVLKYMYV